MSLSHHTDLAAVRARSRTDVAFDHGTIALLHHHGAELAAFADRRLITARTRPFREDPLERLPEFGVEDAVDYRVEGRVTVAEPCKDLKTKWLLACVPKSYASLNPA
jgi:hypothetical protein